MHIGGQMFTELEIQEAKKVWPKLNDVGKKAVRQQVNTITVEVCFEVTGFHITDNHAFWPLRRMAMVDLEIISVYYSSFMQIDSEIILNKGEL